MALNFPPFVVLTSHFRITGGHDLNPAAQTLMGEDQQLFTAFDQLAVQVMASAGLGSDLRPLVVALASMSPGVSALQRVQLATIFVRNAMAALNNPAPAAPQLLLGARAVARARAKRKPKARKRAKPARRRTGKTQRSRGSSAERS